MDSGRTQPPTRPLVSLVIPAYNAQAYLRQAIDSVLAQDYEPLELIVLDDGSTDDTRSILASYGDRIRWDSHPNVGQGATLNKGWAMSAGEMLGYLSADDVLFPAAVGTAVHALQADPGLVLVYPDFELLDNAGRLVRRVRARDFDYRAMVVDWVCIPGPGALFRRDAALAAGPWDPSLRLSPDYDFWLRLGLHGRGRRLPRVLAGFRIHEESQTFRPVPSETSDEYPRVTESYFRRAGIPPTLLADRRQALSSAYLYAARSHLRSRRYRTGLLRAVTAVRLYAPNARPQKTKLLVHGLVHQTRHRKLVAAR